MIEPPPRPRMPGMHGLGGEELVAEVDVLGGVPVLGRHLGDRLAAVVGGVVDEDADRAERGARPRSMARLQRRRCR